MFVMDLHMKIKVRNPGSLLFLPWKWKMGSWKWKMGSWSTNGLFSTSMIMGGRVGFRNTSGSKLRSMTFGLKNVFSKHLVLQPWLRLNIVTLDFVGFPMTK